MRPIIAVLLTMCAYYLGGTSARALNPVLDIGQYKHTEWTIDDGAPRSFNALAQGANGYLWLGGIEGLYRFDGITFEQIRSLESGESRSVSVIRVARNGDVWVGYQEGGTSVFSRGELHDVPMPNPDYVMDIAETPDGTIWATLGRADHQLMRFANGRWREAGTQLGMPVEDLMKMIVARDGTLWLTTLKSLLYLPMGATHFKRLDELLVGHAALSEDRRGNIWMSDQSGSRVVGPAGQKRVAKTPHYPTPTAKRKVTTIFDRDGNLWGMNENGLFRLRAPLPQGPVSVAAAARDVSFFQQQDGIEVRGVRALLEDKEGNIWFSTYRGLNRLRAVRAVSEPRLRNEALWGDVLLGASDGTVYVGEADAVYRIKPRGAPEIFLSAEEPQAICEGLDASIWIVLQDRVVNFKGGKSRSIRTPPNTQQKINDCAVDRHNKLWIAASERGLFSLEGQKWQETIFSFSSEEFPAKTLLRGRDRKLIVAFGTNSLALLDPPHPARMLRMPGSELGPLRTIYDTPDGVLLGGRFGLARIRANHLELLSSQRFPEFRWIAGIAQTDGGDTWLSSSAGIVKVSTADLNRAFSDPKSVLKPTLLDFRDGVAGGLSRETGRALVKGGDGRIWFGIGVGTQWIDPSHLAYNTQVPPVAISAVRVAGSTHWDPKYLSLPAGTSNLEIDFAAPSLSIPERVRMLYKLEGADAGWIDPGRRRQAFYTNLGPGHYVFRAIAANDDGVWNRTGAKLELDIPPTFFQSKWFVALVAIAFCLLLWCAYLARVSQLTARMRAKLEQRLAERERIARDLHDTLLQGFQGLVLRFQSVANQIPGDHKARRLIDEALESADAILSDGRDSVRHLRAADAGGLSEALSATAERLHSDYALDFVMVIEGVPRVLHPVVREELGRIGDEALINAFRHANAKSVELIISYESTSLALGIRDDGIGIDPEIFERGGRQGHFGLVGMRERAQQIDAEFAISSLSGIGTEIQIRVPGRIAYAEESNRGWNKRLRHILGRS